LFESAWVALCLSQLLLHFVCASAPLRRVARRCRRIEAFVRTAIKLLSAPAHYSGMLMTAVSSKRGESIYLAVVVELQQLQQQPRTPHAFQPRVS